MALFLLPTLTAQSLEAGPFGGLLVSVVSGLFSLAFALQVVFPYRLELDAEGFTTWAFWKKSRTRWVDSSEFRVARPFGAVVFEDRGYRPHLGLRAFNRWFLGGDFVVGAGRYGGLASRDLAQLMNTYRAAVPH